MDVIFSLSNNQINKIDHQIKMINLLKENEVFHIFYVIWFTSIICHGIEDKAIRQR